VFSKSFKAPSAWAEREVKYKMEKRAWEIEARARGPPRARPAPCWSPRCKGLVKLLRGPRLSRPCARPRARAESRLDTVAKAADARARPARRRSARSVHAARAQWRAGLLPGLPRVDRARRAAAAPATPGARAQVKGLRDKMRAVQEENSSYRASNKAAEFEERVQARAPDRLVRPARHAARPCKSGFVPAGVGSSSAARAGARRGSAVHRSVPLGSEVQGCAAAHRTYWLGAMTSPGPRRSCNLNNPKPYQGAQDQALSPTCAGAEGGGGARGGGQGGRAARAA
jgi:hypothetical protein